MLTTNVTEKIQKRQSLCTHRWGPRNQPCKLDAKCLRWCVLCGLLYTSRVGTLSPLPLVGFGEED